MDGSGGLIALPLGTRFIDQPEAYFPFRPYEPPASDAPLLEMGFNEALVTGIREADPWSRSPWLDALTVRFGLSRPGPGLADQRPSGLFGNMIANLLAPHGYRPTSPGQRSFQTPRGSILMRPPPAGGASGPFQASILPQLLGTNRGPGLANPYGLDNNPIFRSIQNLPTSRAPLAPGQALRGSASYSPSFLSRDAGFELPRVLDYMSGADPMGIGGEAIWLQVSMPEARGTRRGTNADLAGAAAGPASMMVLAAAPWLRSLGTGARTIAAAESGSIRIAVFDGEFATQQLLGTTTTPGGRQIMFHAADRMVNPPRGRIPMSPSEIDDVLNGATRVVKRDYHPQGNTLTIENANMPGRPRVVVDEATGQRVITVINPRRR